MLSQPLSVILVLSLLSGCLSDSSWNYVSVKTKKEAANQATRHRVVNVARLASVAGNAAQRKANTPTNIADDTTSPASDDTRGQGACTEDMFNDWANTYNYSFEGAQKEAAMKNFCINMERVQTVNADLSLDYWLTGNEHSHLTFEQFAAKFLTITKPQRSAPAPTLAQSPSSRKLLQTTKTTVDWMAAGKVTPIRSQGGCNSCWAFAGVAAIESSYLIQFGGNASDPNLHLSEQQLVSCAVAPKYSSNGCSSGSSEDAIRYAAANRLLQGSLYPYSGENSQCNADVVKTGTSGNSVQLSGSMVDVPWNNEAEMIKAVQKAPVIVYFAVDDSFRQYAGGIYTPLPSNNHYVNHALLTVAYDTSSPSNRYWTLKNSWGTGWGENGFARVKMTGSDRNGEGACAMYMWPMQAPTTFSSVALTSSSNAPVTSAINGQYGQISATTRTRP